jgi:hypothetical protein
VWSIIFLHNLIVGHLVKNFWKFRAPDCWLQCSKQTAPWPRFELLESCHILKVNYRNAFRNTLNDRCDAEHLYLVPSVGFPSTNSVTQRNISRWDCRGTALCYFLALSLKKCYRCRLVLGIKKEAVPETEELKKNEFTEVFHNLF